MSGNVRRSNSRGDINNLLSDIRGIVSENRDTLDKLKDIKQKNDDISKTKKSTDIPTTISGCKKSEIDIPHKTTKTGEHHSEISKRSKYINKEEKDPYNDLPTVEMGVNADDFAPPPSTVRSESPKPHLERRDDVDDKRQRRRQKSEDRKRRIEEIRNRGYSKRADPVKREGSPHVELDHQPILKSEPQRSRNASLDSGRQLMSPSGYSCASEVSSYRIRKDSEGSIEIFPEHVEEEQFIEPEYLPRHQNYDRDGDLLARSRSTTTTSTSHKHHIKRRIVVEKCPYCDGSDSPPEIEIRICARDKCGRYRSQHSLHSETRMVSEQQLTPLESTPPPPARSSSLNRINNIPVQLRSPCFQMRDRPMSPGEMEVERMRERLNQLKQEVNDLAREVSEEQNDYSAPSKTDDGRFETSPVPYPGYYRARYHSAPQTPGGRDNKTTSTTELLEPKVYYPARQERISNKQKGEVIRLSTQSIDLPDSVASLNGIELDLGEVSLDYSSPIPKKERPRTYECDIHPGLSTSRSYVPEEQEMKPIKREEQMLTPPPVPPRSNLQSPTTNSITLRADNLYDPYHIGTSFVVLSKQNHGRFKFQSTDDPNSQPPPSPKSASLKRGVRLSPHPTDIRKTSPSPDIPKFPQISRDAVKPINSAPYLDNNVIKPINAAPLTATSSPRKLYQPKTYNPKTGSVVSIASLQEPRSSTIPPTPERQHQPARGFYNHQEVPMSYTNDSNSDDRGLYTPPPRSYEYRGSPHKTSDTSSASSSGGFYRPYSPNSSNVLRRAMPDIKFLGSEWKELAQKLGYDNSMISWFCRSFPNPGLAFLDHWSRQPDSRLEDLMSNLKKMGLWKTADKFENTFDPTSV